MNDMKTRQAFKFRLCPTSEQDSVLSRHAGGVRFVWNKALDLQTVFGNLKVDHLGGK